MDKTQKRWSFIVNVIFLIIIVGAFYLFMKYMFWTFFPFMVALVLAALLQKPVKLLTKNKKVPKGLVSTLLSLFVFVIIIGLIILCGGKLVYSIKDFVGSFTAGCSDMADFFIKIKSSIQKLDIVNSIPASFMDTVYGWIDSLSEYITSGSLTSSITTSIPKFISPIGSVISTVPSVVLGFIISIIATCFMTASYTDIKAFILRQFKDEKKAKAVRTKEILISSVGKMFKAYAKIILITTAELIIGLFVLKLIGVYDGSYLILISIGIALIDIVPVLGTGTVVIPWSIYEFVTGNYGMGIGLLVIYAVISVIRQIIEPKLVAGQVGMSPVVTIIAMYVGIKYFGAIGIFIVPFLVIIIKLLNDEGVIHLYNSKKAADVSDDSADKSNNESNGELHE